MNIRITDEDSRIEGTRFFKNFSFDDKTAEAHIKIDLYYLCRFAELLQNKIGEDDLDNPDSLGEVLLIQFMIEMIQLIDKLTEVAKECEKESAIEEAEEIIKENNV